MDIKILNFGKDFKNRENKDDEDDVRKHDIKLILKNKNYLRIK